MQYEITHNDFTEQLRDELLRGRYQFPPFHQDLIDFCEALSLKLFELPEKTNDFVALSFWLRKAQIQALGERFQKMIPPSCIRGPLGLVLHFPPSNIEVMFVYSWISSLLGGNANILRIPRTQTPQFCKLLIVIEEVLSQKRFSKIRQMSHFVHYAHDDTITKWLSQLVDCRIIWGGNETVEKLRTLPLSAHAKDLSFPNRFSYAVIAAEPLLNAPPEEKLKIIKNFFNDCYWFDQSACSSPRILFWIGEKDCITSASTLFYDEFQKLIEARKYEVPLGGVSQKLTFLYDQVLRLDIQKVLTKSNELTVAYLDKVGPQCRNHPGFGFFYHVPYLCLDEIIPFVSSVDQTLTYYGFESNELRLFAQKLQGKGLTRMVPAGQALQFDTQWDGHDLLIELTQEINIY